MAEGSHKTEQDNQLVFEIVGTLNLRFKKLNLYYEAEWTDSFAIAVASRNIRPC